MPSSPTKRAFRYFRTQLFVTAIAVTALSGVALAALLIWATPTPDFANNTYSGPLSPGVFTLLETLLSVVISIGGISLIYELFLRETYADDLSHFLNLKASLVNSGLQEIEQDRSVEWRVFLSECSNLVAVLREPQRWLMTHIDEILDAARHRAVQVTIGLPDPDAEQFEVMATLAGLSGNDLASRIQTAITEVETKFEDSKEELQIGTVVQIVQYAEPIAYELVMTEERLAVMLGRVVGPRVGENRVTFTFRPTGTQYPALHWRQQLEFVDGLDPISLKEKK